MEQEQTKKCPFCAEEIKAEAIVCRFCNRDLQNVDVTKRVVVERTAKKYKKHVVIVTILLIIGAVLFLNGLFGLTDKNTIVDSVLKMFLGVLFFVVSLIWGTINRIRMWWDRG